MFNLHKELATLNFQLWRSDIGMMRDVRFVRYNNLIILEMDSSQRRTEPIASETPRP